MKSLVILEKSKRINFLITGSLEDLFKMRDFLKEMKNLSLDVSDPFEDGTGSSYHLLKVECPERICENIEKIIKGFIAE